jgi:hypothetical protein
MEVSKAMNASSKSAPATDSSRWSKLWFGKHKGKTLPQVIFCDLGWFLWAYTNSVLTGGYRKEAEELLTKITHIKPPGEYGEQTVIEYDTDRVTGKFAGFRIVPAVEQRESRIWSELIDLTIPWSICSHDKLGNKIMVAAVKTLFFDPKTRMTASRCEAFFADDSHFDLS